MVNIDVIFEECEHIEPFDKECLILLERVMSVDNPMRFDDDFATDEQLNHLETQLDLFGQKTPQASRFKRVVAELDSYVTNTVQFI